MVKNFLTVLAFGSPKHNNVLVLWSQLHFHFNECLIFAEPRQSWFFGFESNSSKCFLSATCVASPENQSSDIPRHLLLGGGAF